MLLYRANTVGSLISSVCWSGLIVSTVYLSTQNVRQVLGYSAQELLVLSAIQVLFLGLFHALVSHNIERMPELISTGKLDLVLLKPMDSQFGISLGRFSPPSLLRVLLGVGFLIFLIQSGRLAQPSLGAIASFVGLIAVSLVLVYSIWFVVATLLVWLPHMDNIVEFLYNLNVISRYPHEFFREVGFAAALLAYPFSISLVVPLRTLMGRGDPYQCMVLIVLTIGFSIISRLFWLFALRHYTSAST